MSLSDNKKILFSLFDRYGLNTNEKDELYGIINSIFCHDEFQRRLSDEFMHHDRVSLGEHILEVTIFSYILYKKYKRSGNVNLDVLLKTAMFHDLYTEPWQNNPNTKVFHKIHKHAFRHPIEAVINSSVWFSNEYLDESKASLIIDGVVHHMAPLPVPKFILDNDNSLELRNFDNINLVSDNVISLLCKSCERFSLGNVSLTLSNNIEGRIVNLSDKIVAVSNMKHSNINGFLAIFTEKNNNLVRYKK